MQLSELSIVMIRSLAAILTGILLGCGVVWFFNRVPAKWFCDYGEEPSGELADPEAVRLPGWPWRYLFSALFAVCGIWMVNRDWQSAVPMLLALWLLVMMAAGDVKYGILPDQLILLLAVSAIGFAGRYHGWKDCLAGILLGFGILAVIALIGKLASRKMAIGGGDMKLFAALGAVLGGTGVVTVFLLSSFFAAVHYTVLLAAKRVKMTDALPFVPYVAAACAVYWVFLWDKMGILLTDLGFTF